jgi:hypothetical protein
MEADLEPPPDWFRNVVWGSLIAGCCPPLPLPFIDDWARNYLRRQLTRRILADHGLQLPDHQVRILAGEHPSSCLWVIISFPFRWLRLLRVILWVASANRVMRAISSVFLEAYLISHAVRNGKLDSAPDDRSVTRVRHVIENTRKKTSLSPLEPLIRKTIARSLSSVRQFSRAIAKKIWSRWKSGQTATETDTAVPSLPETTTPWAEDLIRTMWEHRADLVPLEQTLDRELQ